MAPRGTPDNGETHHAVFELGKLGGIAVGYAFEIQEKTLGDPVHVLATNWKWEYGPVSKKHL